MYLFKKFTVLTLLLLFSLLITACAPQASKKVLVEDFVVSVAPKDLSESFDEFFPLKKNYDFGTIVVEEPRVFIPNNSQRISASINLDFQTMFSQKILGSFIISGEPLFDKKSASIFLQNVEVKKLQFSTIDLGKAFNETFLSNLSPMVNTILKKHPIYTIPKESFKGRFIKNISIEDSKLLITYGI